MRILVVGRPLGRMHGYGEERYTDELCATLSTQGIIFKFLGDWWLAKRFARLIPPYGSRLSFLPYDLVLPSLFVLSSEGRKAHVIHFVDIAQALPSILFCSLTRARTVVAVQSLNGIAYNLPPVEKSVVDVFNMVRRLVAFKLAGRRADALIAMSSPEEDSIRESLVDAKVMVIPPVSSISAVRPSGGPKGRLTLGCVGKLEPGKRIEKAFQVLAILRQQGMDCRLLICGEGPSEAFLVRRTHELGVAPHVEFTGHVGKMGEFYPKLDFVLFPSLRESFGYPIVEAARCGVLCITFASSLLPPEVQELTTICRDEAEAAHEISNLWFGRRDYAEAALRVRQKAEAFSQTGVGSELERLYLKVGRDG